jgi:hypothetical protein
MTLIHGFHVYVIETVNSYCYLGIVLKCNGSFNLAMSTLAEKARKAYFKIKKTIDLYNPCKLLEKLFDSLILPISYKVSRHVCNPHGLLDKSSRSSAYSKQLIEMSPTKTGSASLHSNFSTMLFLKI